MVQRKDGRWQESITINNKRKYFYGKSKTEVLRKIREYREQEPAGDVLSGVMDRWYDEHTRHVRYKTVESYARPMAEIRSEFGAMPVNEITAPQITSFIRDLEHHGYARRTVQLRLDILRMVFAYAITDLGVLKVNPAADVRLSPGLPEGSRCLADSEDIAKIIEHRLDDRFSLLPFFLMWTGLRLCEALALTDKNFVDGVIIVEHQISWEPNQPVLAPVKTKKGVRAVPLLDVLRKSLPDWKGYLFSMGEDGTQPLTKSAFTKRWRAYALRTGVTCDRHTLRHEFATLLYDADIKTKDAAEMMGHDEKVMLDIYTHIRDSRKQLNAAKLNDFANSEFVKMVSKTP